MASLRAQGVRLAAFVFFISTGATVAAQDRVLLIEAPKMLNLRLLPGHIREIEVTRGGRGWSVVREVAMPEHWGSEPVLFADGSRIVWLAYPNGAFPARLAQYEIATGRAALVDGVNLGRAVSVVADPSGPRVFAVGSHELTIVDSTLRTETFQFPGPQIIFEAQAVDGYVLLRRSSNCFCFERDDDLLVFDVQRRQVIRRWVIGKSFSLAVPRSGHRYYRAYDRYIELLSFLTGELIARVTTTGGNVAREVFQVDESRGLLIYGETISAGPRVLARKADTLEFVGELGAGLFQARGISDWRVNLQLAQTARERAIVVYSTDYWLGFRCAGRDPRIDVFDGATFALVNRIDLEGRCQYVVPIPSR